MYHLGVVYRIRDAPLGLDTSGNSLGLAQRGMDASGTSQRACSAWIGREWQLAVSWLGSSSPKRRAHTKNESYIAEVQLQLHGFSQHGLSEAGQVGNFSTH